MVHSKARFAPFLFALSPLVFGTAGCSADATAPAAPFVANGPIAAGAVTPLVLDTNAAFTQVLSSDPSVVTVTGSLNLVAGIPGTAKLTAYDGENNIVGSGDVVVVPTSKIALDPDFGPTDLAVLVGASFPIHATTLAADGSTLVGEGAINFAFSGPIAPGGGTGCHGGDCEAFLVMAPGDGAVTMTAPSSSATTVVSLHAVTAFDSFTVPQSSIDAPLGALTTLPMTIKAGGFPAWADVLCTSSDMKIAEAGAFFATSPSSTSTLSILPYTKGSTKVTCTVGGLTQTFTVNVT